MTWVIWPRYWLNSDAFVPGTDANLLRRTRPLLAVVVLLVLVGGYYGVRFWQHRGRAARQRATIAQCLKSPDPAVRMRGAEQAGASRSPELISRLHMACMGDEHDDAVRAVAVAALGMCDDPNQFAAVEFVVDVDASGPVRAAAWLAAARLDPRRAQELLERHADRTDAWDRLGQAQARLCAGDARDLAVILDAAASNDAVLARSAAEALGRWLRPVLDAAGRWPLTANPPAVGPWPRELVEELRQRCAALDMVAATLETRRALDRAVVARRMERRLATGREQIAAVLWGTPRDAEAEKD